jgi:hypothetical protein
LTLLASIDPDDHLQAWASPSQAFERRGTARPVFCMSSVNRAALFRSHADECRHQAERAINQQAKERWLKIAEDWLRMAELAESSDAPRVRPKRPPR